MLCAAGFSLKTKASLVLKFGLYGSLCGMALFFYVWCCVEVDEISSMDDLMLSDVWWFVLGGSFLLSVGVD